VPTADRSISAAGLARLLARLDADPDRGAAAYEHLRRALTQFFDWRGAWPPDECADDTLDRLARRLEEGVEIGDLRDYAHGIARLVFLERQRHPRSAPLDDAPDTGTFSDPGSNADEDRRVECFDRCLDKTAADSRLLVLRYYEGERRAKIANRRRLALELGLSENALRSRVQRVRNGLERCVHDCIAHRKGDS